jgi:diguanylate cyclase (GGDEF)-like protein
MDLDKASKHKYIISVALCLIVAGLVIIAYETNLFERLELITLDYRFMLRHPASRPSDIVFIDMGQDSVDLIGRWPWPRAWHATLIKALSDYGPKAISFDVIFSEPQDEKDDTALEEAMRQSGVVYLPVVYEPDISNITSIVEPIPAFKSQEKGTGHINVVPDIDGVVRRVPYSIDYNGIKTYQFGIKIGCDALGKDPINVPLDDNKQVIINWQGKWGKDFPHYSYIDVIRSYAMIKEGKTPLVDLSVFKNKICMVGLTATGLTDIKPIPIQNAYPAVGINATIIDNVLNDDFLHSVPKKINIAVILLICVIFTLYLSNFRPLVGMFVALSGIICYIAFSIALFNLSGTIVATFYPVLGIFLSYGLASVYTQIMQSFERTRLFKQATRDGLTGLYNVKHFNTLLEAEFKNASADGLRRASDQSKRFSIIMIDLDNFKHLNDTYGHIAGDTVLKEFAKIMQSKCRQTDIVARYGGEEFIIMLAGAGEKGAVEVGEKIRAGLQEKKFKFGKDTYSTTISAGVAEFSKEAAKEELVARADKALYRAKQEGKNRVISCDS